MRLSTPVFIALFAALLAPGAAPAQSLADVAKKEEDRRKTVKGGKSYSNKDLSSVPAPSTPPPAAAATTPSAGGAEQPAPPPAPDAGQAAAPSGARDQAYWRGRLTELQSQLDRDQTYVAALQSRINALTTDFVNRDDPAQQAVLGRDRDKAVAELSRLKDAVRKTERAIADLHEEARRAAVPPGWLR